jgi:hypothetical protein
MYKIKEEYKETYIKEVWGVEFEKMWCSTGISTYSIYKGYFKYPHEKEFKIHQIPLPRDIMELIIDKEPKDWL